MKDKFSCLLLLLLTLSCSTPKLPELEKLEEQEEREGLREAASSAPAAQKTSTIQALKELNSNLGKLELKHARMWARLDELEGLVLRQREKIKLLEQGLMLGVIPEGLRKDTFQAPVVKGQTQPAKNLEVKPLTPSLPQKSVTQEHPSEQAQDQARAAAAYKERLLIARDLFQEARFGKAYLEFSKLDREFDKKISEGEPKYWIGRCWLKLKEYHNAKQYLAEFIAQFPTSPWQAAAKYYLARVELAMGLRDNAVKHLQDLIKQHPYEGTAEAAKQLLQNMTNTL